MSCTDKTDPLVVQVWTDPRLRAAQHDHTLGPCDLPAHLRDLLDRSAATRCGWSADRVHHNVCPCDMCTGRPWVRLAVRHDRHETGRRLRQLIGSWRADDLDALDSHPPRLTR